MAPLYFALVAVTCVPLWLTVGLQELAIDSVQDSSISRAA
jgi:hypothetical protein